MFFPRYRPRRMRSNILLRKMIQETILSINHLIYPIFVVDGKGIKEEIKSMPNQYRMSVDNLIKVAKLAFNLGIPAIMLFGIPTKKNLIASEAYSKNGIIQNALKKIKDSVPEILVITDVCLCQYTDHGHCGIIDQNGINNDLTLELISKIALSHVQAGANMVAPSDMMDGRVIKIRNILDDNGFSDIPIMSYAIKYCSSYYGPFRNAADSSPKIGDRSTYQMDPSNSNEAIREALLDEYEGADILMVKPALSYLDIIYKIKGMVKLPIAAYNVSGEYSMIKAAENMGWIDGQKVILETLTSIRRAGANIILTYFALEVAKLMNS